MLLSRDEIDAAWVPSKNLINSANISAFKEFVEQSREVHFANYENIWRWSISDVADFWRAITEYFELTGFSDGEKVLSAGQMPKVVWFPEATLNFAEYLISVFQKGEIAVIDVTETSESVPITSAQLELMIAKVSSAFRRYGIVKGDVVVGYLPNTSHAVIAMLAAASIGAIWSSVGQDYSAPAVIDRFSQLQPKVLVSADGYLFNGIRNERTSAVKEIVDGLSSLEHVLFIDRGFGNTSDSNWDKWESLPDSQLPIRFEDLPFNHPLWVLFSSGTTGKPKGIVHSHGGILLETLKQMSLHWNLGTSDRVFWFTSPSWVMWNIQLSALAVGASIICYDGSPTYPSARSLWQIVANLGVTFFGCSPAYLQITRASDINPCEAFDLSLLRAMGSTGSPLSKELHRWAADHIGTIPLWSISGGTDIAGAFFGGIPTVPIWPGELSVPCLGVDVESWSDNGESVIDIVGELVVRKPMPSMPIFFWGDDENMSLYRESYFSTFPEAWRHGDWISINKYGGTVIHGRSDATLNRNGVRMGSADIYSVVENMSTIQEALVIGAEMSDGSYWMPLFVVLAPGVVMSAELTESVRREIRSNVSPRHVPDHVISVPGIPHTRTGKKLEIPIKKLLQGARIEDVVNRDAIDDPSLLNVFEGISKYHGRDSI